MPGIHAIFAGNDRQPVIERSAEDDLILRENYTITRHIKNDHVNIISSSYPGYPISGWETDDYFIIMEGMIYNIVPSELEKSLINLATQYEDGWVSSIIDEFTKRADGDFFVIIYFKKSKKLTAFNDRYARLAVYYSINNDRLIISRELKFMLHHLDKISFNRQAMAEFLSLEFCLNEKTVYSEINILGFGSMILAEMSGNRISVNIMQLSSPEFESDIKAINRAEALENVYSNFEKGLIDRLENLSEADYNFIADLSGGFDTRAIFAFLCRSNQDFIPVTEVLYDVDETAIAQKLADIFGKSLVKIYTEHPAKDIEFFYEISWKTGGQVNIRIDSTGFADDKAKDEIISGNNAHLMGFGGEFIRQKVQPKKFYGSLTKAILDDVYTHFIDINNSVAMAGLEIDEFRDSIKSDLSEWHISNRRAEARRFHFEYCRKVVNFGEDRHRIFYWTVVPFWGGGLLDFLVREMPFKHIDYNLFLSLLERIDPRTLKAPFFGIGDNLQSQFSRRMYSYKRKFREFIRDNRYSYKIGKRFILPKKAKDNALDKWLMETINECFTQSAVLSSILNKKAVFSFFELEPETLSLYQFLTLCINIMNVESKFPDKITQLI